MTGLGHDFRYAVRQLRRNPGFAAVAVGTLALGIGANAAVFGVVRSVLLRPLPHPAADRLVLVWSLGEEPARRGLSPPDLADLKEQTDAFQGLAGINAFGAPLTGQGEPVQVELGAVTPGFLEVLGARPLLGRTFRPEEETPLDTRDSTATSTIVLSHRLWRERFGGRESAVGRTVRVGGTPMTVVGVLPPDFRLRMPAEADMPRELGAFTPLRVDPETQPRDARYLKVVGRLAPGATLAEARSELDLVADRFRERFPEHAEARTRLEAVPMRENLVGHLRPALLALLAAVGLVLLIACANVAHLLLARGAARRRELVVRAALGADRRRIARGVLTECAVLAGAGGAGGLFLAWLGVEALVRLAPATLPRADEIALDGTVLAFALGASALTAVLFGLGPALRAARAGSASALRGFGRAAGDRGARRLRDGLVVLEVGLSLLLLVGAGLALRSAWELQRVEPGFRAGDALALRVDLPFARYPDPADWTRFFARLTEGLAERPEVGAVAAGDPLPLSGEAFDGPFAVPGDEPGSFGRRTADYRVVTPGYFRALGIPLLRGRELVPSDGASERLPVVVDRTLAERAWPGEDPIGRTLEVRISVFGDGFRLERRSAEVVGLAADVRQVALASTGGGTVYLPLRGQPLWTMGIVVRPRPGAGEDGAVAVGLERLVRAELSDLDPLLPVYDVLPLAERVERALAPARFAALAIGLFAGAALFLAVVGLYGVLSFLVRQRRGEIGIRLALGATPTRIGGSVVRRGLALATVGLALGLGLSVALTRTVAGVLYGVEPLDPPTLAAVSGILLAVAVAASWAPARRAAAVDPMTVLREE